MAADAWAYETTLTVGDDDIDAQGHMNNVAYLRHVERVAVEHSESVGVSIAATRALGGMFVVRRHEITYFGLAFRDESMRIRTRIEEIGGAKAVRVMEFLKGDTVLVAARTEWVWTDLEGTRPRRIPASVIEAFGVAGEA